MSPTANGGVICVGALAVKATLASSAEQTAVVNAALASYPATNNGQSVTEATVPAALISAGVVLQSAGYKL